jgi:FMN reductase
MTRTVVVVTAGLSQPSSTRLLADRLAAATEAALGLDKLDRPADRLEEPVRVEVVEVRDLAHQLVDNLLTGFPSGALADAVALVRDADAVIAVSPIFDASYSGLFKMFFDVLDEGTLEGIPVLLAATAGTARHSLALEFAMRPLFAYLRADVVPTAVFAASEDFGSPSSYGDPLSARVDRAARELADAVRRTPRTRATNPFAEVTPFEQLLAGAS